MPAAAPSVAEAPSPGLTAGVPSVTAAEFAALMAPLGPFGPEPRMVVGVSGGPHSLALALLACRWARARGGRLLAVVCEHGLRPDSAAEAANVARMLAGQGISTRLIRLGLVPGSGMQERAREARFAALLAACDEAGAPWLLLGQHRADQAETLLMRALSGSGPAGLAGMAPARAAGKALVLRPLLGLAPERLEAVVAEAGLVPVRDPSNTDPRFARVRLRAALADPGGGGAAVAALSEAASRFQARRAVEAKQVAARLAACAALHEEGFARLDLVALGRDRVAQLAMAALVRVVGGGAFAPERMAVARLLERGAGTLGGAVLRRSGLLLRETAALAAPVPAEAGGMWDGRFRLYGMAAPGMVIAGVGEAARGLPRPAWLPSEVVPTLPGLFDAGRLAVLPALAYPSASAAQRHGMCFVSRSGAIA